MTEVNDDFTPPSGPKAMRPTDQPIAGGGPQAGDTKADATKTRRAIAALPLRSSATTPSDSPIPSVPSKNVRDVDLLKKPCGRCGFVHRGHQCETQCMGCGSKKVGHHSTACPFQKTSKGIKPAGAAQRPAESRASVSVMTNTAQTKTTPAAIPELIRPKPHISFDGRRQTAAGRLSTECQRRGFNPVFKFVTSKVMEFGCSVQVDRIWIHGTRTDFRSEKDAKEDVAMKALLMVEKWPMDSNAAQIALMKESSDNSISSVTDHGAKIGRDRGLSSSSGGNKGVKDLTANSRFMSSATDKAITSNLSNSRLMSSASGRTISNLPNSRSMPSATDGTMGSSMSNHPTIAPVLQQSTVGGRSVNLPGLVDPRAVHGILENAIANAQSGVVFNLPGNVSVEVAEAYGRAMSRIARPRYRSRSRSRSRSPQRSPPYQSRRRAWSRANADYYRPADRFGDPVYRRRSDDIVVHPEDQRGRLSPLPWNTPRDPRGLRHPDRG